MIENIRLKSKLQPPKPPKTFLEMLKMREQIKNPQNWNEVPRITSIRKDNSDISLPTVNILRPCKRVSKNENEKDKQPSIVDLPKKRIKICDKPIDNQLKLPTVH